MKTTIMKYLGFDMSSVMKGVSNMLEKVLEVGKC